MQVAWIKQANPGPTASLPSASADAYTLEMQLGNTVRAAKQRWPNLKIVFLSSRIYAGYATSTLRRQQRPPVLNVQDFGCLLMRYAGGCN